MQVSPGNGSLSFLLEYLSRCNVCCGIHEDDKNINVVRNEVDPLCQVVIVDGKRHFISRKCGLLVVEGRCKECTYLNKRLSSRKQQLHYIKFTKHWLLGKQEMEQKILQLQRNKWNVERQATY